MANLSRLPPQPLVQRASTLAGITRAFRPWPLRASEMDEFYSESLNRMRGNHLRRKIRDRIIDTAESGFFFQGVVYGNRGCGKSTEINRLLEEEAITARFVIVRVDAVTDLNPQTFSVADVLLVIFANMFEACEAKCQALGGAFHEAGSMVADLQQVIAPFFPELQNRVQVGSTTGGGGELNLLQFLKLSIRVEGQRKTDLAGSRESLAELSAALDRLVTAVRNQLPEYEILVVGENFDKEAIPRRLLEETFVQYSGLLQSLRLHLLFTLPVSLVYASKDQLAFRRENRFPVYDVPVFDAGNRKDSKGRQALTELLSKRTDVSNLFKTDALDLLLEASGGDLYLLFAVIVNAATTARYRCEDTPGEEKRVLLSDAATAVREQLSIFRNELGTSSSDPDPTTWKEKLATLREIYSGTEVLPDIVLEWLLRKRAVLYFNGRGRFGVHPLAVEIMRSALKGDPSFEYRGGGLDALP